MRTRKPLTRNWPSPDELAEVDHGIRKLVATIEPVRAERIRQHRERPFARTQRIMQAVFRAYSRAEIGRPEQRDGRCEKPGSAFPYADEVMKPPRGRPKQVTVISSSDQWSKSDA